MNLPPAIAHASRSLRTGRLIVMPTETVYGLAADACNDAAVAKIYQVKGRPSHNPLIVHVNGAEMAARYAEISPLMRKAMAAFWPGALTLVLPMVRACELAKNVTVGGDTVALRCPAHAVAQAVITAFDGGIAAPSANRSGRISPTRAEHVRDELGEHIGDSPHHAIAALIDDGACEAGLESTIIQIKDERIFLLRAGPISAAEIEDALGCSVDVLREKAAADNSPLPAPGLLSSHYAPRLPVRLNAHDIAENEALLAFGKPLKGGLKTLQLSENAEMEEAAKNLFHMLRKLDNPQYNAIAVMPIPLHGIGAAINDRLQRAAADRE